MAEQRRLRKVTTPVTTTGRLRRAQVGTLGHLCGWPTTLPQARLKTKKPLRRPLASAHRRGFRSRGSGRSRTDDGGFAIRCLSHLATEPLTINRWIIRSPSTRSRHATGGWGVWSSCTHHVDMAGSAAKHGCSDPAYEIGRQAPVPSVCSGSGLLRVQFQLWARAPAALRQGAARPPHDRQTRAEPAEFGPRTKRPI